MSLALARIDSLIALITSNTTKLNKSTNPPTMQSRGAFIVFEGIDRCGKSSQCKALLQHLERSKVRHKFYRFPNRDSLTGRIIDDYLRNQIKVLDDRCVHLLFAANRHESKDEIVADLRAGVNVICDRYSYSGVAYSASKLKKVAEETETTQPQPMMGFDWCSTSEGGLPKPDLVLFLELAVEDAQKRGDFGGERYEKVEFQQRVKSKFERIIADEKARNAYTEWSIVDAKRDKETIHAQIAAIVDSKIKGLNAADNTKDIAFYEE